MLEVGLTGCTMGVRGESNKKGISLGCYNDGVSSCGRGCKTSVIDWHDNNNTGVEPQQGRMRKHLLRAWLTASNDGWINMIRYGLSSSRSGISGY